MGSTYVSDLLSLILVANSSSKQIFFTVNIFLFKVLELLRYVFAKQVLPFFSYNIRFYLITVHAFLHAAIFNKFEVRKIINLLSMGGTKEIFASEMNLRHLKTGTFLFLLIPINCKDFKGTIKGLHWTWVPLWIFSNGVWWFVSLLKYTFNQRFQIVFSNTRTFHI